VIQASPSNGTGSASWLFTSPSRPQSSRLWRDPLPPMLCAALEHPLQLGERSDLGLHVFATIGAISFLTPPSFAARRNVTTVPPSPPCSS
jgi:hypothetical protein